MPLELFLVDWFGRSTLLKLDTRCPYPLLSSSLPQRRYNSLFLDGSDSLLDLPFLEVVAILMNSTSCKAQSVMMDCRLIGSRVYETIKYLGKQADILCLETELISHSLRKLYKSSLVL